MKKQTYYTYLGTNGSITTPIHLEDIYYVRSYCLTADRGHVLTNDGGKTYVDSITVPEDELDLWVEIKQPAGQN